MNARRVNAASGVILAAQKRRQTAAGVAAALEAAGLLQSPESAAELVALRARVAELEEQAAEHVAALLDCAPEDDGLPPDERLLSGDELKQALRCHLFGGGAS